MFTNLETRQTVAIILESKIRGQSHEDAPRDEPPVKRFMGVALEPPAVLIVDEPCRQHLGPGHDAEELAMVRQLGDVVRRRRRGAAQAIRRVGKGSDQPRACFAIVGFQPRGFIKNHPSVIARRDVVQSFVVGDLNVGSGPKLADRHADPLPLGDGLLTDAERRENHDAARNVGRPRELHSPFPEPSIRENRRAPFAERPQGQRRLERIERWGQHAR